VSVSRLDGALLIRLIVILLILIVSSTFGPARRKICLDTPSIDRLDQLQFVMINSEIT
jgi:hypothetical protein